MLMKRAGGNSFLCGGGREVSGAAIKLHDTSIPLCRHSYFELLGIRYYVKDINKGTLQIPETPEHSTLNVWVYFNL